jgi:hypothetical protein
MELLGAAERNAPSKALDLPFFSPLFDLSASPFSQKLSREIVRKLFSFGRFFLIKELKVRSQGLPRSPILDEVFAPENFEVALLDVVNANNIFAIKECFEFY